MQINILWQSIIKNSVLQSWAKCQEKVFKNSNNFVKKYIYIIFF